MVINIPNIFKLEAEELEMSKKWIENQLNKDDSLPCIGERFTYCFTPTGLGTIIKIIDNHLKEQEDVTCWDWWD